MAKKKLVNFSRLFNSRIFMGLVIFALLGAAVWAIYAYAWGRISASGYFIVKEVKTNIELSPVVRNAITGKTVFALSTRKIYDFVRSQNPELKNILVTKEYPSSIIIRAVKRSPVVQVKANGFYPVDAESVVVSGPLEQPLPGLVSVQINETPVSLNRGQRIDDRRLYAAMGFVEALRRNGYFNRLAITEVNAVVPAALFFVAGDTRVIIGDTEYERKLKVFETILRERKGDISMLEYVDLRYQRAYLGAKK